MKNTLLRFTRQLTQYSPLLRQRVENIYSKIFEGIGTNAALSNLRDKVGDNSLETEGDGVFGLSGAAGFKDSPTSEASLDKAIDDGIESGNLEQFGTAIPTESLPTEEDFGLGADPMETTGDPLADLFADDSGSASDLGLDGLDDEFPEEEPDIAAEPELPTDDNPVDSPEGGVAPEDGIAPAGDAELPV